MKKSFSERLGIEEASPMLQTDSMNTELRNSIWNMLYTLFENRNDYWIPLAKWIAQHFRKFPVDELPVYDIQCRAWIKDYFYSLPWNKTYEFIEFIVNNYESILQYPSIRHDKLEIMFNYVFEREMSGFRFIANELAPISNPAETQEISSAIEITSRIGLDGAHHHLKSALSLFAKKPDPDYRNSIKESISAVESIAKILGKENSHGLADALAELAKKTNIHGALQSGFIKLYGYTSDEDGIRHAILDEQNVGFDEAKYMVVSCSAFVNYLIAKAETAGLLK
jgi:hypothetical protein